MREDRKFNANRETLQKSTKIHASSVPCPGPLYKRVGLIDQGAGDPLTPTVNISPKSWFLAGTLVSVIVPNH